MWWTFGNYCKTCSKYIRDGECDKKTKKFCQSTWKMADKTMRKYCIKELLKRLK